MSNSKHTPGPWHIIRRPDIHPNPFVGPDRELPYCNNGVPFAKFICQVDGTPDGSADANARLIAAAPEMYSELNNLYSIICVNMQKLNDIMPEPDKTYLRETIDNVCTLLARIDGEADNE